MVSTEMAAFTLYLQHQRHIVDVSFSSLLIHLKVLMTVCSWYAEDLTEAFYLNLKEFSCLCCSLGK